MHGQAEVACSLDAASFDGGADYECDLGCERSIRDLLREVDHGSAATAEQDGDLQWLALAGEKVVGLSVGVGECVGAVVFGSGVRHGRYDSLRMSDGQSTSPAATTRVTRLAPSPTGALHLGNARTFVLNWVIARTEGMRVVLRIEDLDGPRVRPGADTQAIEDLRWLGLDWDVGPTWQLHDLSPYRNSLQRLARVGAIYPCRCTRKELQQAQSAPHAGEHELRYPGTCRPDRVVPASYPHDNSAADITTAWRFRVPDVDVTFIDRIAGLQRINVQQQVGDFVVATKAGLPAYQLAVVIDDALAGVTDVVRGDDLLGSAARQTLLYDALALGAPPTYWHLPLVVGPDGRRLAKRHGDTRLSWYRERGVDVRRVVGLIAFWSGLVAERTPLNLSELLSLWRTERLPLSPVTFTQEDHAWLLSR